MTLLRIRRARVNDAESLLAIYRPYVKSTVVSFELVSPAPDEFRERINKVLQNWVWLVAEKDDRPVGYAYGTAHRPREAYRYSVETSAYVDPHYQRSGIARRLYSELLRGLKDLGYANAYAGIALPNEPSLKFHQHMGFCQVGVFPRVGRKFDRWHDVAWMHRPIG